MTDTIKTWKDRMAQAGYAEAFLHPRSFMQEEIDELRAALAQKQAPVSPASSKMIARHSVNSIMADTITRLLEAAEAEPHASPRLINACRSTRDALAQQAEQVPDGYMRGFNDTITLPRSVVSGALHALDLSQGLLASARSIHHITVLEEYKSLRAALAQQAEQAPTGFEKYLKEGETPLQRLEREIKDGSALMKIYGKALTQIQELQAQRWTTPIAFYEIANNEYGEIEYEFSVYPRPGFKPLFAQAIPAAPKGGV